VQASALQMAESAAAFVRTGSLDAAESALGVVIAREATVKETTVPLLVAGQVKADQVRAVAVMAGRIDGTVKAVFTPVTAVLAGASFALTLFALAQLAPKKRKR
jgi:hypothetical protein